MPSAIARNLLETLQNVGIDLSGKRLLELGPGIEFGSTLMLGESCASVAVADRFLSPLAAAIPSRAPTSGCDSRSAGLLDSWMRCTNRNDTRACSRCSMHRRTRWGRFRTRP